MKIKNQISLGDILAKIPISKSSLYRYMRQGKFPQAKKLPENGGDIWSEEEVFNWWNNLPKPKFKKKRT